MPAKAQPKRRGRPGRIGNQIFEQVQSLVTDQKLTRTGAFKRIAEKSGRNMGTVAANYYRIARQRGVKLQRRRRRGTGARGVLAAVKGRRGKRAGNRALAVVQQLGALLRQQASEIDRLRRENLRFEEIRKLISRN
jgi:hypothetical protein